MSGGESKTSGCIRWKLRDGVRHAGGEMWFVIRRDESVETAEIVRSTGVAVLDRYIMNAVRSVSCS
jgi:hypothetical protein